MPNAHYIKGRKKEYKIIKEEREKGNLAFRSAGSHSPIDVISIDKGLREIKLIQCKPNNFSETQKKKLLEEQRTLNGFFFVEFEVR